MSEREELIMRASAVPLAFKCPGSARRGELVISESGDAANLGSGVHEALRPLAEVGAVQWDELPTIAAHWGVSLDDLRMLVAVAAKLWSEVSESFAGAMTEVPFAHDVLPGVRLTGHADLLASTATTARLADWKSGRKDSDYAHQMRAYGTLALVDDPNLTEVTVTILWIRESEIENYTMTRADAGRWLADVEERIVKWDGTFRPGPHCRYCPRSHDCAAANALARRDVAALLDEGESDAAAIERMTPEQIVSLHRKASHVLAIAKRANDAIKAHVLAHGDIESDGARLTIDVEERREIDTLAAWPVLEKLGFDDEDFAETVEVRISKVEKRVAKKAGRGKGAGAVRALGEQLKAAGAVKVNAVQKLVERRKAG